MAGSSQRQHPRTFRQSRTGGDDIIKQQNLAPGRRLGPGGAGDRKSPDDIPAALLKAQFGLAARIPDTNQDVQPEIPSKAAGNLPGQYLRMVVPPTALPRHIQRNRQDQEIRAEFTQSRQGEKIAERLSQPPLKLILKTVDRLPESALITANRYTAPIMRRIAQAIGTDLSLGLSARPPANRAAAGPRPGKDLQA